MKESLQNILTLILTELKEIKEEIKTLKKDTDKMKDHIDFVEDVYQNVKNPLTYICSKFNSQKTIKN